MPLAEIAGGSLIVIAVVVLVVAGLAYGLFTVRGSGISRTPIDDRQGSPGAEGPAEVSGVDQREGSATGSDAGGTATPSTGRSDERPPETHDEEVLAARLSSRRRRR